MNIAQLSKALSPSSGACTGQRQRASGFVFCRLQAPIWIWNVIFVIYTHVISISTLFLYRPSKDLLLLTFLFWSISSIGITMGYHRLWSHRSYTATFILRILLAALGTLGFQGSIKWWSERHRLHHRFTDTKHDPYNAKRGFWFSHMGWIFYKQHYTKLPSIDISDLTRDSGKNNTCKFDFTSFAFVVVRFQHQHYVPLALMLGFILPTFIAWCLWDDALGGFLYGGHLAKIISWHTTFCINSFAHWLGSQDYSLQFTARGNLLLALLTHGEGKFRSTYLLYLDYWLRTSQLSSRISTRLPKWNPMV